MRNLDAIINQLAAEQQRCEHLLIDEMESVKKACTLFFDKQQREADAFMALLVQTFDDITIKVKNGYPKEQRPADEMDPLPAIVTGRKLSDEERDEILKAVGDAA
jgi:hypothetical protein